MIKFKKHFFHVSFLFYSDIKFEEVVEIPETATDKEIEEEFKEWVWDQLDAYRTEVK